MCGKFRLVIHKVFKKPLIQTYFRQGLPYIGKSKIQQDIT